MSIYDQLPGKEGAALYLYYLLLLSSFLVFLFFLFSFFLYHEEKMNSKKTQSALPSSRRRHPPQNRPHYRSHRRVSVSVSSSRDTYQQLREETDLLQEQGDLSPSLAFEYSPEEDERKDKKERDISTKKKKENNGDHTEKALVSSSVSPYQSSETKREGEEERTSRREEEEKRGGVLYISCKCSEEDQEEGGYLTLANSTQSRSRRNLQAARTPPSDLPSSSSRRNRERKKDEKEQEEKKGGLQQEEHRSSSSSSSSSLHEEEEETGARDPWIEEKVILRETPSPSPSSPRLDPFLFPSSLEEDRKKKTRDPPFSNSSSSSQAPKVNVGFSPNLLFPTSPPPESFSKEHPDVHTVYVSPERSSSSSLQEIEVPLPPGGDMPEKGSDSALDLECRSWTDYQNREEEEDEEEEKEDGREYGRRRHGGFSSFSSSSREDPSMGDRSSFLSSEDRQVPDEEESLREEEEDKETSFWRRMPASDKLRWAARRLFRLDTHSILALPIFFFIVFLLLTEGCLYIGVRLTIALTEAISFQVASFSYSIRSFFYSQFSSFSRHFSEPPFLLSKERREALHKFFSRRRRRRGRDDEEKEEEEEERERRKGGEHILHTKKKEEEEEEKKNKKKKMDGEDEGEDDVCLEEEEEEIMKKEREREQEREKEKKLAEQGVGVLLKTTEEDKKIDKVKEIDEEEEEQQDITSRLMQWQQDDEARIIEKRRGSFLLFFYEILKFFIFAPLNFFIKFLPLKQFKRFLLRIVRKAKRLHPWLISKMPLFSPGTPPPPSTFEEIEEEARRRRRERRRKEQEEAEKERFEREEEEGCGFVVTYKDRSERKEDEEIETENDKDEKQLQKGRRNASSDANEEDEEELLMMLASSSSSSSSSSSAWGESLSSYRARLSNSKTYEDYVKAALAMDVITGRDLWKKEIETNLYDYEAVGKRLHLLRKARHSGKFSHLREALYASIRDQMFGVFKEKMYSRSYIGTKYQVEEFLNEVYLCLKELKKHIPHHREDVRRTSHHLQKSWGTTALVFSGGAALGLHHFGVVDVLLRTRANSHNLLPRVIGGCSAGAVVAAWLCTRTDEELLQQGTVEYLVEHWKALSPNSWIRRLWNVFTKGYMCDMDVWKAAAKKLFGDLTFLEAYQRTGRILNISMTRADRDEQGLQVMNYVNAPNVLIWSALLCSCAFPFLSLPMPLREKNAKGEAGISKIFGCSYFHDGSLSGDIPTEQMREEWSVSYAIVSQVNIHVFPFAGLRTHGEAGMPVHWRGKSSRWRAGFLLSALELLLKEHIRFLLRLIALLDVSPTLRGINAGNLALQQYTGDVTLHPRYISLRYLRFLNDTAPKDIAWYLQEGRLMTFPKLHLIRNRICIDRCFEEIAEALGEMDHPDLELYSFASSSPSSSPRGASTTSWGRRGIQKVVV